MGWITILIGAVGLLRMVPEAVSMGGRMDSTYPGLLVIDFFLLLMALGIGRALIDAPGWACRPALFLWGALTASAVVLGNGLGERLSPKLFTSSGSRMALLFAPRLALYGLTVLASPYAFWVLGVLAADRRPKVFSLVLWIGSGGLLGGLVSLLLIPQRLW